MKFQLILFIFALIQCTNAKQGFRQLPQNISSPLGSDIVLRCSGYPSGSEYDLHSQWRTNTGTLLGFKHPGQLPGHDGRYSYIRENPEELHLKIQKLELSDDGIFECQMFRRELGPIRTSSYVNVIVPPESVLFQNYQEGSILEFLEDIPVNITCLSPNVKPPPKMSWYLNGKVITHQVNSWIVSHPNKTVTSYTMFHLRPTKSEHNKILTCESIHEESGTRLRTSVTLHVLYSSEKPKIDVIGGLSNMKSGKNATLICTAKGGNPPPNVSWFLNDRPIDTTYTYDYHNQITRNEYSFTVEGSDNGAIYECRSSNRPTAQPLSKTIILSVKYPPSNVFIYGNATIRRGQNLKLTCISSPSNPASAITWTINDTPVKLQPHFDKRMTAGIATESNLTLDSDYISPDAREVVVACTATNQEGTKSQQHTIRVLIPPQQPIIYTADNGPLLEGDLLNLTCEARGGHPPADITWYRGIQKRHSKHSVRNKLKWKQLHTVHVARSGGLSSSSVTIKLDRSMNDMPFRCEAENDAVDDSLIATRSIKVLFPPKRVLLRQPDNDRSHMRSGEATRLSCIVPSSNPPAEVQWEFETTPKSGRIYTLISNITEKSNEFRGWQIQQIITFIPDETYDGTSVQCIASHPLWNDVVTANYKLSVYYPPRIESDGLISVDIEEGSSFQKNLSIISNPPISGWRWKKNGVLFDGIIGSIYARGSIFGGRSVNPADSGIYTVLASNLFGTANVSIKVTVRYPARIIHITSPVIASVGEDVVLECEADGNPHVKGMVKWMRYDNQITSIIHEHKRAVLRLNASHETSGPYTCVANNGIGSANHSTAYLLVKRAPKILRNPGYNRAAGSMGGRAKLKCLATGIPDATFQWSIEGENNVIQYNSTKYLVHEQQLDYTNFESTLWIMELNQMDYSRRIKCRVSNQLGHDSIYVTLSTPTYPDVPTQLEPINVTNTSVSLSWIPGFSGGSDQIFELRIQKEDSKEIKTLNFTKTQAIITDLEAQSIYYIQIRSINDYHRSSEFSLPPIQIKTTDDDGDKIIQTNSSLSYSTMIVFGIFIFLLIICNSIILCYRKKRKNRKRLKEKTEYVRTTLMNTNDGAVRAIQTYGTVGTPGMRRRPDSSNTNRSDLFNDRMSEDDQSVRTMIEVNPNGCMQRYDPNCIVDYDYNPELYSGIHKGITYAPMPYPEPPQNGYYSGNKYTALEPADTFTYPMGQQEFSIGGPSGMSTLRRGSFNDHNHNQSPALSTFVPHNNVRPSINPHLLEGDLV